MGEARAHHRSSGRSLGRSIGGRPANLAMTRKGLWLWLGLLFVAPLAVYWQTVFHEYGFRDDYSLLREAHDEPFKLFRITTSNGRPVYGAVLEASMRPLHVIGDLPWLRLLTVALLASVAAVLWRLLRRSGWSNVEAGMIALGIALLPGAQITVGWAIAWPIALALLFAVVGFSIVESSLRREGRPQIAPLVAGGALYFLAGLTYQSNALFAIVPAFMADELPRIIDGLAKLGVTLESEVDEVSSTGFIGTGEDRILVKYVPTDRDDFTDTIVALQSIVPSRIEFRKSPHNGQSDEWVFAVLPRDEWSELEVLDSALLRSLYVPL